MPFARTERVKIELSQLPGQAPVDHPKENIGCSSPSKRVARKDFIGTDQGIV
jgi:hypothetical protein